MITVSNILSSSGVKFEPYQQFSRLPAGGVVITQANQLIGAYSDLERYREFDRNYFGWEAHHIVETRDYERLGVKHLFPDRNGQICVLIPKGGHSKRINSLLQRMNPHAMVVTGAKLREAYREAYELVGDYCGGGELRIRRELMAIVSTVFRLAGVR